MTPLLWIILFSLSASVFFCTAAVIIVIGIRDLKNLLATGGRRE